MSKIEKLPYPENIQFTTEEGQRYEDDQYEVDKDAKRMNKGNTGTVVIYKNQEDEDLVVKRAEQILWDLGKGDYRPKTNMEVLEYRMDLIRGDLIKEKDKNNRAFLFNAINVLVKKIPEAVELDNEAEERVSMGAEEEQTKQNIIDVKKQKKKDKEDEKRRLYQEEQYKIFEENEKKREEKKKEVLQVTKLRFEGVLYLKDPLTNTLYDPETREEVGTWNSGTKTITPYKEEELVKKATKGTNEVKEKKSAIKSVNIKSLSTLSLTELRNVYNASVAEYRKAKEEYTIAEDALNKAQESGHSVQIALKGNAWTSSKEKISKARDNAEKIKKLYDKMKEKVGGKLDATELKGLLNASYDGREQVGDWVIDKKLSTNTSKVYTNNEGRAVVAHKGTEGVSDWGNNLAFAVGGEYLYKKTDRFKEAKKVQNKAEKKYGAENVSTIGHSQGGLQAELLGSKSKEIITLNKATHPLSSNQSKNQTDIRSDRDVVSGATKTPTTEIKAISYNPLTEHSPKILDRVSKDTQYGSGIIDNPDLYEKAKEIVYKQYPKHSAYRSGQLVKKYKEIGGTYSGEKDKDGLTRWFKEEWKDIGNKEYPVFRPTKRITKDTPLTPDEIKPSNLKQQIALKQEIKGDANLPPFKKSGGKLLDADNITVYDEINKYSNPKKVQEKAKKYLGEGAIIYRSIKKDKKYMIYNPNTKKWIHFGQIPYEDFTKHQDPKRRENYLTRTANMRGNWKNDKYSANNLSREILW
jgi:hypothetical protein